MNMMGMLSIILIEILNYNDINYFISKVNMTYYYARDLTLILISEQNRKGWDQIMIFCDLTKPHCHKEMHTRTCRFSLTKLFSKTSIREKYLSNFFSRS